MVVVKLNVDSYNSLIYAGGPTPLGRAFKSYNGSTFATWEGLFFHLLWDLILKKLALSNFRNTTTDSIKHHLTAEDDFIKLNLSHEI